MVAFEMNDEMEEDNSQKYRSGYLKRLELQNFMCHKNYSITFSPRLNVITGKNGSGKSAILHGILLALAAGNVTAGRGSFARAIKFGEKWARTRLVIDNSGVNALPEWGDEIIIERLLEENKSSFKITGSSGRKERRRNVVDRICTDLTLNINNPCVVLTQEQSKQLFANTDGKKRMEFLASATQLAQTELMMKRDLEMMKVIESNNKEKTELRQSLGRKYKIAKKKWIEAKKLQDSDSIIKKLRDSKVYLEVDLLRKNWAINGKEIKKYSGGIEKCLEAKSEREGIIAKWKKVIQESKEEISQTENNSEPFKDEKNTLDSKKIQAKRLAKDAYHKFKQFDRAYKQLEEQLQKNQSRKQTLLADLEKELGKDSAKLRKVVYLNDYMLMIY
jgi:chromosome segregation ATPase